MADNSYELDDGYGDEGSYEEVDMPVGAAAVSATAGGPPDLSSLVEKGHIKSEEALNVQTRLIVFEMTASPVDADRKPTLCESKLQDHIHQHLQEVRAIANRHDPKAEELSGDLDQIVITNFETVGYISRPDHPVMADFVGLQVPGVLTSNDRTNLVLEHAPTFTPYTLNIHNPVAIMAKDMLKIWERCDDTVLDKEFQWVQDSATGQKMCFLCHDGAGANLLRAKPQNYGGFRMGNKVLKNTNMVPIPAEVGAKLYTEMKNTIDTIKKSFTSVKDIKCVFRPQNGRWNDPSRYFGDVSTVSQDKQIEHNARMMSRPNRIAVHVRMEYIPVPKQFAKEEKK